MARYTLDRGSKQTYIDTLLKVSLAMEITIAIDKFTLAANPPVQGGKDGCYLYMHSPSRISTKNKRVAPLLCLLNTKEPRAPHPSI